MDTNERDILLFTSGSHALVHTYELSIPILVVIWLLEFPVTTASIGLVVTVGYALFGLGALPGGVLADRFSSRSLIIAGVVGMGLSFFVLSFATGLLTIALALAGWGGAASVYHPAALSLISTGVEDQGTGFAYHGMAGNLGTAVGPLLTALLLLAFEWQTVVRFLVVPAVVVVGYALTAEFDEMAAVASDGGQPAESALSLSELVSESRSLFTGGFVLALCIVMMNGLFYRGTLTFLPDVLGTVVPPLDGLLALFGTDTPLAGAFDVASSLYVGLLILGIGGQYIGGRLSERLPPTLGLAGVFTSLLVIAVAFVPAARTGLLPLLLVSALLGFFLFALQPLYQSTIATYTPPDGRGLSYGYTYLVSFGVGAAGAAISGYLLAVLDLSRAFLALGAFPTLGLVLSVGLFRWGEG